MARNEEKLFSKLNRLVLQRQKEEYDKNHPKRPKLEYEGSDVVSIEPYIDQSYLDYPCSSRNMFRASNETLPAYMALHFDVVQKTSNNPTMILKCKVCNVDLKGSRSTYYNFKKHAQSKHNIDINANKRALQNDLIAVADRESCSENLAPVSVANPMQVIFDNLIVNMIAMDGLPLNIVEGNGFNRLVEFLRPDINVKTAQDVRNHLNSQVRSSERNVLSELWKQTSRTIHLVVDIWSTTDAMSILSIKCHYITSDFEMKTKSLTFSCFDDQVTAGNIEKRVLDVLNAKKIDTCQLGFVTVDTCTNVVSAFNQSEIFDKPWPSYCDRSMLNMLLVSDSETECEYLEIKNRSNFEQFPGFCAAAEIQGEWNLNRITCLAHAIQLAINESVKSDYTAKEIFDYVTKVIEFFQKHPRYMVKLKYECGDPDIFTTGTTRWNSALMALQKLRQDIIYSKLQKILHEYKNEKTSHPSTRTPHFSEQKMFGEISNLLQPLQDATDTLLGGKITSSLAIATLLHASVQIQSVENTNLEPFKSSLLRNLRQRFQDNVFMNRTFILATVLDPRFKMTIFSAPLAKRESFNFDLPTAQEAESALLEEFELVEGHVSEKPICAIECEIEIEEGQTPGNIHTQTVFDFLKDLKDNDAEEKRKIKTEILLYLDEPSCSSLDPLEYWKKQSVISPVLASLAAIYLGFPATSGHVNRLLSIRETLWKHHQNHSTNDMIEKLLILKDNLLSQ